MLVVSLYFNYLATVLAFSKHSTIFPEMHIQVFIYWKSLISSVAKLAFNNLIFFACSVFLLLGTWLTSDSSFSINVSCYCFLSWRSFSFCLSWINTIDFTKSVFKMLNLSLSKPCEIRFDFVSYCFVDFKYYIVALESNVTILMLVTHESILKTLLMIDWVFNDWKFLQYLVKKLHSSLNMFDRELSRLFDLSFHNIVANSLSTKRFVSWHL